MTTDLLRRLERAPEPVRHQILALLAQSDDDEAWSDQVGPAYTTKQVASLLQISRQAVAKHAGLVRLVQRNGHAAYPVVQFDGDRLLPGVDPVVRILAGAVATPWTTASWLTTPQPTLAGRTPIDALRDGDDDQVTTAARAVAASLAN